MAKLATKIDLSVEAMSRAACIRNGGPQLSPIPGGGGDDVVGIRSVHRAALAVPHGSAGMIIAEVARAAGLPARTIRYYEEIGLIQPKRRENGDRAFAGTDLHKLAFVGQARSIGFLIAECRALLALYEDCARVRGDVKTLAVTLADLVQAFSGDHRPY